MQEARLGFKKMPMNTLALKDDWNIVKGKLKQKRAGFTDGHALESHVSKL